MKKIYILVILILFSGNSIVGFAAENPLISGKGEQGLSKPVRCPAIVQYVINKITPVQRDLREKLTQLIRNIKKTKSKKTLLILIGFALIYGIIHAVGPGHGKTIAFSYFLSKKNNSRKGIILGSLIAFLQVGSAILIVLVLYFIIKQSHLLAFDELRRIIKLISYALITSIGIFLSYRAFVNFRKRKFLKADADLQNNHDNIIPVAVSIGMVPCPAAVIVLLFSLSLDMLKIGIMLVLFMAVGMAGTISFVGTATIFVKKNILKFLSGKSITRIVFQTSVEVTGALVIFLLGITLFIINF